MSSEMLRLTELQRIDELCDSFEEAWRSGRRPRIEDYLDRSTILARTVLFRELLAREIELRRQEGEAPEPSDYEGRFGEHGDLVGTVLGAMSPHDGDDPFLAVGTDHATGMEPPSTLDRTDPAAPGGRSVFWEDAGDGWGGKTILPERIGRYRPSRLLGRGNFLVFLAHDEQRGRDVAIKTARPGDPVGRRRLMSLGDEARRLRSLDHPGIVRLHEFVPPGDPQSGEGGADGFIVLEYVAGQTLENLMSRGRLDPGRLARIVADVASAVNHAHNAGLTHRDLKPSNILLDAMGRPRVCDFGLAIDEEIPRLRRGEVAGTVPYMSPEQVQGETNRLDGRTDIWALGVILYRGLTGRLPFRGRRTSDCFREILDREPRPPRQFGEFIPRELERICLRCLSRQMTDRYLTAADLASELRRWLAGARPEDENGERPPASPRGMRPFRGEDAESFVSLLPGPRGSDGLPESIRFWKLRIEGEEASRPFSVGVLFGPSGGGKSSFIRAGLLPLRDRRIVEPVVLDATPCGLEDRLLAELRLLAPQLPADVDIADAIGIIRDDQAVRPRKKILLVLDQFEQWLQGRPLGPSTALARALRQCDGRHVQAILLVRDDFWMATTRLMRAVEVPLLEGVNTAAVEIFDARHARKVLEEFGRSLGQLGPSSTVTPEESSRFLDAAVAGLLGPDDRVVPVRLSLLVEVIRHRQWTLEAIDALGGMEGIGVKFLEQAFDPVNSTPASRFRREEAEAVLRQLLPSPSSRIRESPRSARSLRAAAGCDDRPEDFADLLRLLENDLRLITPVEPLSAVGPAADTNDGDRARAAETHYQLAHDYLIRPVRQWLERKAMGTSEGRARLRLQAFAASWAHGPTRNRLPSLLEYLGILTSLPRRQWSAEESTLMNAAGRHHAVRLAFAALLTAGIAAAVLAIVARQEARAALDAALWAKDEMILEKAQRLDAFRGSVLGELERLERRARAEGEGQPVVDMLLFRYEPTRERAGRIRQLLLDAPDPDRVNALRRVLASQPGWAGPEELRRVMDDPRAEAGRRLRAACALRHLLPGDRSVPGDAAPAIAAALVQDGRHASRWMDLLGSAEGDLITPLGETCRDPDATPLARATASELLGEIFERQEEARRFAEVLVASRMDAAEILLRRLPSLGRQEDVVKSLRSVLAAPLGSPGVCRREDDDLAGRQAIASIALDLMGFEEHLTSLLSYGPDPRVRAVAIDHLAGIPIARPRLLVRVIEPQASPGARQAILMSWAEVRPGELSPDERAIVLEAAARTFRDDPDPGVHSAAELLLRRLGEASLVEEVKRQLLANPRPDAAAEWRIGPLGLTFVACRPSGPASIGSPPAQEGRKENEALHLRSLGHDFEVSTCEVSIDQFRRFRSDREPDMVYSHDPSCPANGVDWYGAARFCNWLTSQDPAIPWDQCCYPDVIAPGMLLDEGATGRSGYRLPTEAEWEFLCRAGTATTRPFGDSKELFPRYGWTWLNSDDRTRPVGQLLPNPLGLFDTLGNVWEWCHDGTLDDPQCPPYPESSPGRPAPDRQPGETFVGRPRRLLRGGAFCYSPSQARSAHRYMVVASNDEGTFGFRVVRTIPQRESPRNRPRVEGR
ncbi:bifunctional serine/threonine-protein kinase/formylglycine-generating enzyme family protein [Aquisphaera giovannonii]|nr:bifunctional serine/threonine-protein kinase/formylglycine-generating enzyme family protein [Aquisphaera giovannonii]